MYVFRFAPREADVENVRGGDADIDGSLVCINVGSLGRASGLEDCKERREKAVDKVEKLEDCVLRLGMRRSDLRDCQCLDAG